MRPTTRARSTPPDYTTVAVTTLPGPSRQGGPGPHVQGRPGPSRRTGTPIRLSGDPRAAYGDHPVTQSAPREGVMRTIVLAVSAVLLLAGCGGARADAAPPAPSAPSAPLVTPAPGGVSSPGRLSQAVSPGPWASGYVLPSSPGRLSREEAARRYLALVGPANAATGALDATGARYVDAPASGAVPAVYRRQAAAASAALRALAAGLLSTAWPSDVARTADRVADEVSAEVTVCEALSRARTWGEAADAWARRAPGPGNAASQRLRVQLGLPAAG